MAPQPPAFDITIEVDPSYVTQVDTRLLASVTQAVLEREGVAGPLDLGIWITNEDELRALNRKFRAVDATTDVLSFGADGEDAAPFVDAPDAARHLGDVAISFPHVMRQAREYGHSEARELAYLLAHGILHLLGYDHEAAADAGEMRAREEAALGELHITRGATDAGTTN